MEYVAQTTNDLTLQELQEQLSAIDPSVEKFSMTTIAEQLRQEGHQEGLQKGHQEGLQKGHQEGLQRGLGKGIVEGQQRSVIGVLEARGFVLSPQQRTKIEACTTPALLSQWVRAAVTVQDVDELFDAS